MSNRRGRDEPPEETYPAVKVPRDGSNLTTHQFILPIRIRGVTWWGVLDTGANISVLPKEVAEHIPGLRVGRFDFERTYTIAGVVDVPYQTHQFDIDLLKPIDGTIQRLDIDPYDENGEVAFQINRVEFQVLTLTYPEIASYLEASDPIGVEDGPLHFIILGVQGVLESLNLTFVGNNAVTVQWKQV